MVRSLFLTIKDGSGVYNSLDRGYEEYLNEVLSDDDDEVIGRWETYNLIMDELISDGKIDIFNEIRYRFTDGEDPNEVILDVILRLGESTSLMWFMKKRIEDYIEDDFINRFY